MWARWDTDPWSDHLYYPRYPVQVLRQLTEEKFIVKATNGPRYVVGCRRQLEKSKLKPGTRVALDMTTLTIMRSVSRHTSLFLNSIR